MSNRGVVLDGIREGTRWVQDVGFKTLGSRRWVQDVGFKTLGSRFERVLDGVLELETL
jgi:hypothetical protein